MRRLTQAACARVLSHRILDELSLLQGRVGLYSVPRNAALRRLLASRHAATACGQQEFWQEFCRLDRDYRTAVRRLAQFCREQSATPRAAGLLSADVSA
jgi:hypothetical protein